MPERGGGRCLTQNFTEVPRRICEVLEGSKEPIRIQVGYSRGDGMPTSGTFGGFSQFEVDHLRQALAKELSDKFPNVKINF